MKKTILITGCSSGIGLASVKLFVNQGWNVIATMRKPSEQTELINQDNLLVTQLDVQDITSINQAITAGISRFGKIDVLINNAGYGQFGLFEATSKQKIQEQFEVNVFGVMDVTRAILPHFRTNKAGIIINVSSGCGIFGVPIMSLYCASKFALEGFTEALSFELGSQNIIVKSVIPHGGVGSTRFNERSFGNIPDSSALHDYDAFVTNTKAVFGGMITHLSMSSDDVAKVIFTATTDGSDKLRYLVGDDSSGFMKARRELSEENYIEFMRSKFKKITP